MLYVIRCPSSVSGYDMNCIVLASFSCCAVADNGRRKTNGSENFFYYGSKYFPPLNSEKNATIYNYILNIEEITYIMFGIYKKNCRFCVIAVMSYWVNNLLTVKRVDE